MNHLRMLRLLALSLPLTAALPAIVHADPRPYRVEERNREGYQRFRGAVQRVYSDREFSLRVGDDVVRVKSQAYLNLRRGDYVDVRGELRGRTLYADTVRRLDDNAFDNGGRLLRVDFLGEVLDVNSHDSLRVRMGSGRIYFVRSHGELRRNVSRGDLVRVRGQFDGTTVSARNEDVSVVRDGAYPYGAQYNDFGRHVGFPATIRFIDRGELEVRGGNRQTYRLHASDAAIRDLRVGDRVEVEGISRDEFVQATRIERAR